MRVEGLLRCNACLAATEKALRAPRRSAAPRLMTAAAAVLVLVPALFFALGVLRMFGLVAGRASRLGAVAMERADRDGGR